MLPFPDAVEIQAIRDKAQRRPSNFSLFRKKRSYGNDNNGTPLQSVTRSNGSTADIVDVEVYEDVVSCYLLWASSDTLPKQPLCVQYYM